MKAGIKFAVVYSIITLSIFGSMKLFFKELTMEIFSYLLFYYVVILSIGIVLFPLFCWLLEKLRASPKTKLLLSFGLCLLIINLIPFFSDNGRILALDMIKGVFSDHSLLGFNNLGIHIIALVSFISSYLFLRNNRYWTKNLDI